MMAKARKRENVCLRDEPQPDPAALARVDAAEDHGVRLREEPIEEFAARLEAWRADPTLPEPHEDDTVEDRSACDFGGMTCADPDEPLKPYADWLRAVLPGHVHGFSPSLPPDGPTPPRHDPALLARSAGGRGDEARPPLTAEYVKCLQRRARLGMALHRPEDAPRRLPGRDDT